MTMHQGHRQRMRERFQMNGLDNFAPHEVLELLLFSGHARGDVNPLAHALLETFGSLKGVLEARPEQLMAVKGVGQESATLISMIVPLFRKYQECVCAEHKQIRHLTEAREYCRALLTGLRSERFYVIALSASGQVLGQRIVGEGSINEVPAYPRLVVETALNYNASSILLCHNHPGGVATPSPEDVRVTRSLYTVLSQLSVRLVDHIIITGSASYSMTEHNDILGVRDSSLGTKARRVREEPEDAWQHERTWEE